jgi:hypothetical protein
MVREAERGVVLAQEIEDRGLVPARVPKLDRIAVAPRQRARNAASRSRSACSIGGSWNSTGPDFAPKAAMRPKTRSMLSSTPFSFFICVMKRDAFQAKRKSSGVLVPPGRDRFGGGQAVEGVVDLGGREPLLIEGEKVGRAELRWIERTTP